MIKKEKNSGLCERVRMYRKIANMSITELSEASNITINTIVNLEKGHNHPHQHTIRKIAKALGVTPILLISGDPAGSPDIKWRKVSKVLPDLFNDNVFDKKSPLLIVYHPDFGVRTGFMYKMEGEIFWSVTNRTSTGKMEVSHWAYANTPMS